MERKHTDHEQAPPTLTNARTINLATMPIEQLGLGAAARMAAHAAGLAFVADLAAKTEAELKVLGLRPREINNIADRLNLFGLSRSVTQNHSYGVREPDECSAPTLTLLDIGTHLDSSNEHGPTITHSVEDQKSRTDDLIGEIFVKTLEPAKAGNGSLTDDERALRRSERVEARGSTADASLIERLRHKATMTVEEAAQLYGCSRNTAYRECKLGRIPTLHQGRSIRVITALVFAELHL